MTKPTFEQQARSIRAERRRLGERPLARGKGSASTNPTEPSEEGNYGIPEAVLLPSGSLSGEGDGDGMPRQQTAMLDLMARSLEDLLLWSGEQRRELLYERVAWLVAVFVTAIASASAGAIGAIFATLSMIF